MADTRTSRTVAAAAVLVTVAALVTTVALYVRYPDPLVLLLPGTDMRDLHVDFHTFWHSAVALTQGADIYDTPAKLTNLNPPLLTVLLVPFAAFDALTAYRIFLGFTVLLVLGSVLAVARELRLPTTVTVAAAVAVLASSPLHGTLVLGQIYPLLLVGLVAGWIAERRGRPVVAAVLYGITVALKPSLAPLLLLPAVQRRWVPLRAGIASAAVATLLGVLVAGPSTAITWLTIALTEGVPDTPDNASLPGLAMRYDVPSAAGLALGLIVLTGTLAWCGRRSPRESQRGGSTPVRSEESHPAVTGIGCRRPEQVDPAGTAPWAVLAAALLLAPIAWHNYLLLLVPGVLVLCTLHRRATAAALLAVAVVPISWNTYWPEGSPGRSLYVAILLAYWIVLLSAAPLREVPLRAPESATTG